MVATKKKGASNRQFSITTLACGAGVNRPKPPLFEAILRCDWVELHTYLTTGSFQDADKYGDSTMLAELQAQKWVSYYDTYTQEKVKQLPLHAAISHLAPLSIIQIIINLYPEAVHRPDNNGNLPLHLAFTTNMKDVSSFLLKAYPEALMTANNAGSLPIECYHHIFSSLPEIVEAQQDATESRAEEELLRLQQQIARDEHRMAAAEHALEDMKNDFDRIQSEGRHRISQLSDQNYASSTIDL